MITNRFPSEKAEFFDFLLENDEEALAEALIEETTPSLPVAQKNRLIQLANRFKTARRSRLSKSPSDYFALVTTSGWGRESDTAVLSRFSNYVGLS